MIMLIPVKPKEPSESSYHVLGLRDLPFPTEPVVNPYSPDPRINGTIYATEPVLDSINKFQHLLVRPDDFSNRVRLAYLWSEGDVQSGRGMGKTALLRYFRQRINKDWGISEFSGQFSALVVYVAFPSQVDRRFIEQLAWSGLVDICSSGVLEASRAALRYDGLAPEQAEAVVKAEDGTQDFDNLLRDEVLRGKGIESDRLDSQIAQRLVSDGVKPAVAHQLATGQFESYLRSLRRDGNLVPFYVPRDTKNLDYSRTLLFDDIVYYLRAARFAGGYLFVDDIENLVDQMARKERIEFAKEFAICTVRPGCANSTYHFFSSVLTTHSQASVSLSQAWAEAGLAAIARLDPNDTNSVELPLPKPDQAKEIIVAHLDYFRVKQEDKGTIKPFTQDGIEALLKNRQLPRVLLASAATVILHAVEKGAQSIDSAVVVEAMEKGLPPTVTDFTAGLDSAI
jgi:hypothetical protein